MLHNIRRTAVLGTALTALVLPALPVSAAPQGTLDTMANEKVAEYDWIRPQANFVRRVVDIPMRDGVKLHTVIIYRKGLSDAPMLLTRTPYDAEQATSNNRSQDIDEVVRYSDRLFVDNGYIRVFQDIRGQHASEGDYVMNRPLRGEFNKTKTDHATDTYDTIDWLVKNVKESNGKVGMIGSSYEGFTALMGTVDPHPALKATVPQSPMVDGWIGDDWFHNGAFRTFGYDYDLEQTVGKGGGAVPRGTGEDYAAYLKEGSAYDYAEKFGLLAIPAIRKVLEHPAYDSWWQYQAVDKQLAKRPLTVPMLLVVGEWDQEDSYGAPAVYKALEPKDTGNDMVSLAIGPWRHSGVNYIGRSLGDIEFAGDTAKQFRERYELPFLDCHLKTNAPKCDTPPVITYASGIDKWEVSNKWPDGAYTPLYLAGDFGLSWSKPATAGSDSYVSDPAKPVPMLPRPVHMDGNEWKTWLVQDQRFADSRTDVLSYSTGVLAQPVHIKGAPKVDLHAFTSGQDSDFVVKLIDVYPEENTANPKMAGYELPMGIEIFRGRYVHGFATPAALEPGKSYNFKWALPNVDHVFLPGHRIMVQVQSSLFPLYDRNPQSWVPSIMKAKPSDYVKATETVQHGGDVASAVWLPVVQD